MRLRLARRTWNVRPACSSRVPGGGIVPLLIPSLCLLVSAVLPRRRGRALDVAHVVLLLVFFGLWLATRLV